MDRTFVAVLRGSTPETAKPIVATEDIRVVNAVAREIFSCLSDGGMPANQAHPALRSRLPTTWGADASPS